MNHSLEELLVMMIPMFVGLQGFIVVKRFFVKEGAILKKGTILILYIVSRPMPWHFLTRYNKSCASC